MAIVAEPADAARLDRRARGAAVEAAARDHLKRAGLRELVANANYRGGELDLVMLEDGRPSGGHGGETVVFIEVRFRNHAGFGGGAASIDRGKRRKLVHAAQLFLVAHREYADAPCRFDVIDASGDPSAPHITWLRDAFRADDA
jgi:putative endonuclease